jgi:branched-chain amino acid aminotransferase
MGEGQTGPVTRRLRAALLDIQEGRSPDPDGWRVSLATHRLAVHV